MLAASSNTTLLGGVSDATVLLEAVEEESASLVGHDDPVEVIVQRTARQHLPLLACEELGDVHQLLVGLGDRQRIPVFRLKRLLLDPWTRRKAAEWQMKSESPLSIGREEKG